MQLGTSVYSLMEFLGTVSFALSGAMVAMQRRLDFLGVIVLGLTTAFGGGICRDILIGQIPPSVVSTPKTAYFVFWITTFFFIAVRFQWSKYLHLQSRTYEDIMNLLDAVGLGIFTAPGINRSIVAGFGDYTIFCIFLGVLTGIGGGIIRDLLAGLTPSVLRKHIYACASLAGALIYYYLRPIGNGNLALILSSGIVVMIRVLAKHYRWNLPTAYSDVSGE